MIKFGPSGNSESFYAAGYSHTEEAAAFVKERGLDCFEYSFGRGVRMSEEKALSIGEAFREAGVEISVHAPYFVNFANPDDEMAAKSYGYVLDSGKMAKLMGGKRIVFHPAAQGKVSREEAVQKTEDRLKILRDYIYLNDLQDMMFCPETMGKIAQIGTVEEVTRFCRIDPVYTPCVDFGHINAREQGSLKTADDYLSRLSYMISELGYERMKHFHVHFSKIMYSSKGEVKHLTFEDTVYGPEFAPLALALKELKLEPYIVSESAGTQVEDAAAMKHIYFEV
ncbi:MAG TPA: TIM barrel protein [Candidatus Scatosoma pullicola]|nr:TIM barrel protein [Candidatus Scatosoma pullicola]